MRNTQWVYGVAIYVGHQTKIFMNQRSAPSKFSTVEKQLNKITIGIFIFDMFCCVLMAALSGWWEADIGVNFVYAGSNPYNLALYIFRNFLTFWILFNRMIPVSNYSQQISNLFLDFSLGYHGNSQSRTS